MQRLCCRCCRKNLGSSGAFLITVLKEQFYSVNTNTNSPSTHSSIHFHTCSTSVVDLRQFASSDLSLQSASPSHFQFMWTHSPLPHWNSPTRQRGFWGSVLLLQRSMDSSDLSLQSGSPSQLHSAGIHSESLHRNSCWPQVGAEHFSSSLASPQSSSPSQTKIGATHFPLRHWKSLDRQALASTSGQGQLK